MKRKVLLLFVLALVTLVVVGILGRTSINRSIRSIEEASAPNRKLNILEEVFQDLLDAESSVRTYTITENRNALASFGDAAYNIDSKLAELRTLTTDSSQLLLLEDLDSLIENKFDILKQLIEVKSSGNDSSVLQRVRADIEILKKKEVPEELQTIRDLDPESENNSNIWKKLFGNNRKSTSPSDSLFGDTVRQDLSSEQVGEALARIGEEEYQISQIRKQREQTLTRADNRLMNEIRSVVQDFEGIDENITANRTERLTDASESAKTTISTIMLLALIAFAALLLIIFNDISRNQRNREELAKTKEKAEKLARVKEDFLSNMSHEIRTPLNAVIGFTEQLEASSLDGSQKNYVEKIHRSGQHLLQLINDILDYAKLESGEVKLEEIGFKPAKQTSDIIDLFQEQAGNKQLYLRSVISPELPSVLIGDPVRFNQIIINLVSNALKFTREGGIEIRLYPAGEDRNGKLNVILEVSDTGVGIAEEKIQQIFQEFAQADSSIAREYGGTGLGLSIVQKITTAHNGNITVASEPGKGTTFKVTLQYGIGGEQDLPISTKKKIIPTFNGQQVLAVDDQEFNRELVETILKKWNIVVTMASNGNEAVKLAGEKAFDLILMDIQMPGMSGLEASEQIRNSSGPNRKTPIIALTAGASRKEQLASEDAGMNGMLLKPFTQNDMHVMLSEHFGKSPEIPEVHHAIHLDMTDLVNLANGDDAFVINMLEIFLKNNRADFAQLDEAVKAGDLKQIRSLTHKMIPPCRHLGFTDIVDLLRKMEHAAEDDQTDNVRSFHEDLCVEIEQMYPLVEQELRKFTERQASSAL